MNATQLKDLVKVYDGVIDKQFCQNIIDKFEEDKHLQEYHDRDQKPTFTQINITQYLAKEADDGNLNDPWSEHHALIQNATAYAVREYQRDLNIQEEFPEQYALEQIRIKRYLNNGSEQFKEHVDVGDYNSARRFLVFFLYLNDVEVGGETSFPSLDLHIQPKCGSILVFPPLWMYPHEGRLPVSGDKYIVGSYLHYV
jgi:hypothetical protein